jgi:hypothetical protein
LLGFDLTGALSPTLSPPLLLVEVVDDAGNGVWVGGNDDDDDDDDDDGDDDNDDDDDDDDNDDDDADDSDEDASAGIGASERSGSGLGGPPGRIIRGGAAARRGDGDANRGD